MASARPRILAHRGASGHRIENSLDAFREARRLGADGVELDVHTTRDGALIVHHDPELPGLGPIASLDKGRVLESHLSNGEPTPDLPAALAVLSGMDVWIELKTLPPTADAELLATIAGSPTPERCSVHSFDHRIIARLGREHPGLSRGILSASYPVDPVAPLAAAGANTLWQEWHLIDADLVASVHRWGAKLIAWTVNDVATARRLTGLGVDGLCGNFPERLR
jgi:glycerophosphoryl diester phosphodiesterase